MPLVTDQQVQGIFFASPERPNVVTVQSDMITARWFRRGEQGASLYPGFDALADDLSYVARAMSLTPEHADKETEPEETPMAVAQLTYTDLVVAPDMDMGEFASTYLKGRIVPVPPGDGTQIEDLNFGWNAGVLDFRLILGKRRIVPMVDEKPIEGVDEVTAYTVEWIAGTRLPEGEPLGDALGRLHRALENLFLSSITEYAKEEWEYSGTD